MPTFADYFSDRSEDYRTYRPQYPAELFDYLAEQSPSKQLAWDCGCGNGQASVALAERFQQVIATDASSAQIQQAQAKPNIDYRVAPAENLDAVPQSLDLITVAQAIHWFDHPRFFPAVDRALKPGGVLAAWGYQLLYTDTALDPVIEHFHSQVVGPYWPQGRELLDAGYTKIPFPYPREQPPTFYMRKQWTFADMLGYLNTWSAVKRFMADRGENPLELELENLKQGWGDTTQSKHIYWPLILYVGKKE